MGIWKTQLLIGGFLKQQLSILRLERENMTVALLFDLI